MQVNSIISLFLVCLCISQALAQKDEGLEDYGPEPDGPAGVDPKAPKEGKTPGGEAGGAEGDPNKSLEAPEEEDKSKTKFSDERFAKLFPARTGGRSIMPRPMAKPKPTLPSFIKSTPPLLKATLVTTPAPRGGINRARSINGQQQQQASTRRGASTTTTPRPSRNRGASTPRQLSGRLSTSAPYNRATSAPGGGQASATPSAAALAASRRLRQGNGVSRFQRGPTTNNGPSAAANSLTAPNNSTIPALNPRRN